MSLQEDVRRLLRHLVVAAIAAQPTVGIQPPAKYKLKMGTGLQVGRGREGSGFVQELHSGLLEDTADELRAEVRVFSPQLHVKDDAENTEKIIAVKLVILLELPDVISHLFVCGPAHAAAVNGTGSSLEYAGVNVLFDESAEYRNERMLPAEAVHFAKIGIESNRGVVIGCSSVQTDQFRDDGPRIAQQNINLCIIVHILFNRHIIFRLCTTIY